MAPRRNNNNGSGSIGGGGGGGGGGVVGSIGSGIVIGGTGTGSNGMSNGIGGGNGGIGSVGVGNSNGLGVTIGNGNGIGIGLLNVANGCNNNGNNANTHLDIHNLFGLDADGNLSLDMNQHNKYQLLQQQQQPNNNHHNNNNINQNGLHIENFTRCCVPTNDCFKVSSIDFGLINMDDLRDCVRVVCNNENCPAGQYMHRECFENWEQNVLSYLKSIGRARSWSDRQRQQNLWTKKGYDLVFKACGCKCGRGHIKKDLDWIVPIMNNGFFDGAITNGNGTVNCITTTLNGSTRLDEDGTKKKKKRNRNQKPTLAITNGNNTTPSSSTSMMNTNIYQQQNTNNNNNNNIVVNGNHNGSFISSPTSLGSSSPSSSCSTSSSSSSCSSSAGSSASSSAASSPSSIIITNTNGNFVGGGGGNTGNGNGNGNGNGVIGSGILMNSMVASMTNGGSIVTLAQQSSSTLITTTTTTTAASPNSIIELRTRTGSLSSSVDDGATSTPGSGSSDHSISPYHNNSINNNSNTVTMNNNNNGLLKKQKSRVELYSERVRTTSGCNGIFSRRLDFSTFNVLPKTRLNSYQIKMEDEGNHGNDETRLFILSSLAQHQKSRVCCILCEEAMLVFDRYPLVDGSFFLSPKQHSKGCIEVKYEGRSHYLTAVCMGCLEGVSHDRIIRCRFCAQKWEGSSLVLGTMYSYDIFAAMPCCTERLKCNNCFKLLLHPHQRLNFFSDYSHVVSCPYCATQDTHFVKPLAYCYTKQPLQVFQHWP